MKKNYALIILMVLITSIAFSQPTITYNGNCPQIGDVFFQSYFDEQVDPGPSGENQNWVFSTINISETGVYEAMDPSETPFGNIFTESNIAFHINNQESYNYEYNTSTESVNYGTGFNSKDQLIIHYSNPSTLMIFPFSYNNTFSDTYFGSYTFEGLETHESGTSNVIADGWGSITTPNATYNNVLRVKTEREHIDSVFMEDMFLYATNINYTDYAWYAPNLKSPVFAITLSNCTGVCDTVGYYTTSTQQVVNIEDNIEDFKVYPNPASDKILVSFITNRINKISISIVDLMGREIMQYQKDVISSGLQSFDLPLNTLENGLYFVKIDNGNSTSSKKIIVR